MRSKVFGLAALLLLLAGCRGGTDRPPRLLFVFIDMSASIAETERQLYQSYMDTIISSLRAGDRLVIGKISDGTMIRFSPIFAQTLKEYSFWMDNPLVHKRELKKIRAEVTQKVDAVLQSAEKTPATEIIMSFLVSENEFRKWRGAKRLVLISDMLEYSRDLNLEKAYALTPEQIDGIIDRLRQKNRIARLDSVEVWIAGATAQHTDHFLAVKAFWERYIQETGAILEHYSHDIGQFE